MKVFVFLGLIGLAAAAQITSLPGAPPVNFNQYSGYFDVGGYYNGYHMHYWLIESQNNPATDPVVLWLAGGPWCSGLGAIVTDWGPYRVSADGATLSLNPHSWNRNATILVLESPVGTGFSYADYGITTPDDSEVARLNHQALWLFYTTYPKFAHNEFFVVGHSYGGIYVPTLIEVILKNLKVFTINIKGFAIGNGCVSEAEKTNSLFPFEYAHGMIDDIEWTQVKKECCNNDIENCQFYSMYLTDPSGFCKSFVNQTLWNTWISPTINPYNIYSTCNNDDGYVPNNLLHDVQFRTGRPMPKKRDAYYPCMDNRPVTAYFSRPDVRAALFIPPKVQKWELCNHLPYRNDVRADMTSRVQAILAQGLRGMLYYGDVDMACNFILGERFTRKLGLQQTQAKTSYSLNGQNAGYHTHYGNISIVTVRGAGHLVPTDKPAAAFHIIDSFLNNKNL